MRRYAQLYLLYVAGFLPLVFVTIVLEALLHAPWTPSAYTMGYEYELFVHIDLPWLFISGVAVAAILRVLLNRIAARQPGHYLLFAAGAGVVALAATECVLASAGPLVHSDAWQVPHVLLDLPATCVGFALLYGLVAAAWIYSDSFPQDGLFRLRSRLDRAVTWLDRPVLPQRGAKKLRRELDLVFDSWNPDDASEAVPPPAELKELAELIERDDEEVGQRLDELGERDEEELAKLFGRSELEEVLRFVVMEIMTTRNSYAETGAIDATVGREILEALDRCEELLADQEVDAEMARVRYKVTRFLRKSRAIAEVFVKISDAARAA